MSTPNKSFEQVAAASTLNELLSFYDESFIYCCYRTLLGRNPDDSGLAYYLDRLREGEQKLQILTEISDSPEALQFNANVKGLKTGIRFQKLVRRLGVMHSPKQQKKQGKVATTAVEIKEEIPNPEYQQQAQKQLVPAVTVVRSSAVQGGGMG